MKKVFENCLICQLMQIYSLRGYQKDYLVKCKSCGFVFSSKKPTIEELEKYYDGYGRNDYLSSLTIKRYNEWLDIFEPYRKTNKILDIGCGIGYFLEQAKKRGWEVYGTEFTDRAVEINKEKGINIYKGKITDIENFEENMFDVITSIEVIEHINNPLEELPVYKKILRDGGVFYLTTPNFNSIERYRLKGKYNAICYPEHLSYYTPKTIRYLFEKYGFKTRRIETTGISITRIKKSMGKSSQPLISEKSDDEIIRNSIESKHYLILIKKIINKILTVFGVGNSLKAMFINLK